MSAARQLIKQALHRLGYDVQRIASDPDEAMGRDPFADMKRLLGAKPSPVIFDVGANVGQSVGMFKQVFPSGMIHSFEPSPSTFRELQKNVSGRNGVFAWNCALGAVNETRELLENRVSDMSSFLELSTAGWGQVDRKTPVAVRTLDDFCREQSIETIDILKSDTQGYDLDVFKGASGAMARHAIRQIYFEVIFSDMYKGIPSFDQTYRFLIEHGFLLVAFYRFHFQSGIAGWSDVLFVDGEHHRRYVADNGGRS